MFLNTLTHTNCTSDPRPRKISVTGHSFTKNELFLQLTAIPPPRSATRSISDIDSGFSEIDPENASFDDAKLTSHTPTAILNPIAISTFNLLPDAILVLSASAQILHANTTAVELFSCSLVGLSIDILFPTFPAPCSRNKKHVLCACTPTNPSRTITVECTFGTSSREALLMNYCGKDNGKDLSIMTMRKGDEPRDGERKSEVAGKECGAGVGKRDRYRESRYYTEFEELELLGRGGFGTVYKARNLLDEQMYAIKKVRLNCPPDELIPGPNSSSSSFGSLSSSSILSSTYPNTVQSRILREVKTFARVSNHPNICRYYNAWVEVDYDSLEQAEQVHLTHDDDDEEDVDTFLHPNMDLFNADFDLSTTGVTGDEVAFEYSNSRSGTGSDETWEEVERSGWDEDDDGDTEAEQDTTTTTLAPSRAVEKKGLRSVLYIQMQWCPYSDLRKWLAKRTDVEPVESLMIFKQIVQAIVHVHSQGFTHQDIKPENVYIDDRGKVYLGDFGLSSSVAGDLEGQCTCGCHEDGKNYDSDSDSDSESDHENDEHGSIFFMDPTRADDDHDHEDMIEGDHAKPVSIRSRRSRSRNHSPSLSLRACCHCRASKTAGAPATMTYSAPELLIASLRSGSQANRSTDLQAADIYSLGIVFLELFCVFGTRMERAVLVTELRKTGVIPHVMSERYPQETIFLSNLLHVDPNRRPTAHQILYEHLPNLFAYYGILSMTPDDCDVLLAVTDEPPLSISTDSPPTSPTTSPLTKLHMSWTPRPHNTLRRWRSLSCSEKSTTSTFGPGSYTDLQMRRPMSYSVLAMTPRTEDEYDSPREDHCESMSTMFKKADRPTNSHVPDSTPSTATTGILQRLFSRRGTHPAVVTAVPTPQPQRQYQGFMEHMTPVHSPEERSARDGVIERLQQDLEALRREVERLRAGSK